MATNWDPNTDRRTWGRFLPISESTPPGLTLSYVLSGEADLTYTNYGRGYEQDGTYAWPIDQLGVMDRKIMENIHTTYLKEGYRNEYNQERELTDELILKYKEEGDPGAELSDELEKNGPQPDDYVPSENEAESDWESSSVWDREDWETVDDEEVEETNVESEVVWTQESDTTSETSEAPEREDFCPSTEEQEEIQREICDLRVDVRSGWPLQIQHDTGRPPTAEQKVFQKTKLHSEISELEFLMLECQAKYKPDDVISLICELYKLLTLMGHWEEDYVVYPPHTNSAVDVELAKELGYNSDAIYIIQRLPYLRADRDDRTRYRKRMVVRDTWFLRYTESCDLEAGRHGSHIFTDENDQKETIDRWYVPIAYPQGRNGWAIVLDTKLGAIRSWKPAARPSKHSSEYARHCRLRGIDYVFNNPISAEYPHEARFTRIVPAADYFRTWISAYRTLKRIPVIESESAALSEESYWAWKYLSWEGRSYKGDKIEQLFILQNRQRAILNLYHQFHWPDPAKWDRAGFLAAWAKGEDALAYGSRGSGGNFPGAPGEVIVERGLNTWSLVANDLEDRMVEERLRWADTCVKQLDFATFLYTFRYWSMY